MSESLDSPENGIEITNGRTCIASATWDTIIKWVMILIIAEIAISVIFVVLRTKRHNANQQEGIALVKKSKLSWKLAKRMKRRRRRRKQ